MDLRDALKLLRSELGITQMELANALHINFTTVGRWENGKTLPTRSMTSALMEYALTNHVSQDCVENLRRAIDLAAKAKIHSIRGSLYTVEHASLGQLIDEASFPIYVCDMETDELLYLNAKAEEMIGKPLEEMSSRKCYKCLMHSDTPCVFCHKHELVEDRFIEHHAVRLLDGTTYNVQGKRVRWNGRAAHVRYITQTDSGDQLKSIIENMNGGVTAVIYGDDGDVRHAYRNKRYLEMFGYTSEQFTAELNAPYAIVVPEDIGAVRAMMEHIRSTGQPATFRYRARKRNGDIICMRCCSSLASIEGLGGDVVLSVMTDITQAVQTEQQALVFGQRLHAIMDNINNGVAASVPRKDGTVDYVFVTDRYYEMLGYTREQYHLEVTDPFQLIYSEDVSKVWEAAQSMRRVGENTTLQYRAVRRDGRIIWLDVQITMMAFADVDAPVQLSVFTDITHLVEANEQLAAQRDQIREMLNTTPSGLAVIELDPKDVERTLHTLYYNDRFFSFSGYTREEYHAILTKNELGFVVKEDVPLLLNDTRKICAGEIGTAENSIVRCHTKDGGYRWLLLTGQLAEKRGDICIVKVSMVDITARKITEDKLRISEEMLRIAAESDKRTLITYDVKANVCHVESRTLYSAQYGQTLENIPQSLIDTGIVSAESSTELQDLFTRIRAGQQHIRTSLSLRTNDREYQWFECNAATVPDADGNPDHAILVFHNITEQRLKEAVFKKWQNSIQTRPAQSYTLFRCNLSKQAGIDEQDGRLIKVDFGPEVLAFNDRTKAYADQYVYPDDHDAYCALLNSDTLMAMFYRGEHSATLEYRETADNGTPLWRLLTVEMVEYLNSTDIQVFLMYEDIDERKKAELKEQELAETDPLTGVLNRVAFAQKVESFIKHEANAQHALLMMDMDGFKQLNDTFGHAAGDRTLLDTAAVMRAMIRDGDLICRLGGDEFLIWLRGIPYDAVIDKIARQICEQVRKAFSQAIQISASVGIAVYPRDGHDFDELYHNADKALYRVKQAGKNNYAFFSADARKQPANTPEPAARAMVMHSNTRAKRRMLIVDDDATSRIILANIFKDDYLIETAKNGTEAMVRLRHFSTAISVVLLDLCMPGLDGYEVLHRIQANADLRTIPIVVVSADEDRETLLKAIESGAADYVTKPVDTELIRLRVKSAVSKAENERLRAQNSYLQLQRDEELKYHTVLESTGTVVIEYDWRNHVFVYANDIAKYIAGNYDHRSLWQVFLSDMVAGSDDVKTLQDALMVLANDRERQSFAKLVVLRTPSNKKHWFRMSIYKQVDAFGLAEKMIITFNDVHEEVLSNEKLLFQATRDELTGLYNRAGFIAKAAEMIAAKEPGYYVIACIDIEKFKVINDQYGTQRGDEVLRGFAAALQKTNNGKEVICCRVMADNFAVLYPAQLLETQELIATHNATEMLDGSLPPLKIYVGRCIVDDTALDVSAIYDRASIAKDTVKGRYDAYVATYDESMRSTILRQQEITSQMKPALQGGQFEVWLQPQFNHATGMLTGAEALVRWRHPKEGIISPAEFIPIFEKNGFVYEVDKFVWEETCKLLRGWLDQGLHPVPISVNISRYDVFRPDLVSVITKLIEKYRLPSDLLRLEITESAFSESAEQIIEVVQQLVKLGFVVEIDDFGSGYSSLNTLKDVPAQILKMDMRFLENDENAQRGGSIIESVVRMAKWLGMTVIAEGVETIEQADYLKSIGCEHVQGYLYSRPTQIADYTKLYVDGQADAQSRRFQPTTAWNSNAFWNPNSMETLIFNSYVGGACIFEYNDEKTELLRYNDAYAKIFGSLDDEDYLTNRKDILSVLDDENAAIVRRNIETAVRTKTESTCECRLACANGKSLYIRTTIRLIAQAGDRNLFYCVVADITAQREAERGEREAASRIAAIMEHINAGVATSVVTDGKVRYLMANDRYFELLGYTREQYASEGLAGLERMQPDDLKVYEEQILGLNRVGQVKTLEFRARRRDGRWVWLRDDIAVIALTGVDMPVQLSCFTDITLRKQSEERLRFVNELASDILATADAEQAIRTALDRLMAHFCAERCYIVELDAQRGLSDNTYEVCAEGIESMRARLQNIPYSETDFWYSTLIRRNYLTVENVDALRDEALKTLLSAQNIRSIILAPLWRDDRLIGFAGVDNPQSIPDDITNFTAPADYLALLLSRRDMSRDIERGNADRKRLEKRPLELLDNLPNGAALYEYDGEKLSVIHINKRYWALVGRDPADYSTASVMDVIYPDDRSIVLDEVASAIRQARIARADARILCGDKQYRPFHISANIRPAENGKYVLYVSYIPIDDQSTSLQEMLPIMLSTMMATSEELAFIKDRQGRYIACSKTVVSAFGLASERDIIGKTSVDLFGNDTVQQFSNEDQSIFETGKPVLERLITLPLRNGTTAVYCTSKYPLLDRAGKVVGIYSMCRDVTEEKATEFELHTLLRVIPSGVIKYSADDTAQFAYVNRNFIESLGYTEAQFRAKFHNCFREMIWAEDREKAEAEIVAQEHDGLIGRLDYRIEAADGQLRWFHDEGVQIADANGKEWRYVTLVDITAQRKSEASLRLAEEEYRIATRHSGHTIGRYDIATQTLAITEDEATRLALPECIPDVPYGRVRLGKISEDTAKAYIAFYENIMRGQKEGAVTFKKLLSGGWRWITEHSTTIFGEDGKPVSAIISYVDVTDQQEKEIAYKRWQQSIEGRDPKTYTLFRCNLNKNSSYDMWQGSLLHIQFDETMRTFNDRTAAYASQCVYEGDRDRYIDFLHSDTMLAEYYRGHRTDSIEYRENTPDGTVRWLKLSVDLVESPHSTDVEAYLLYENIDDHKKAELEAMHMAQTDPLTGLLNRKAFAARANELIRASKPGTRHAFLMLDIDGFKMLNDTFGHAAGDDALIEASKKLQALLRQGDLLGRLGGDEFVILLNNISNEMDIARKSEQICRQLFKTYNEQIQLSASIGVAMYPKDGTDSHALYEKADVALYASKANGRNTYRIYSDDMPVKGVGADLHDMQGEIAQKVTSPVKRRILIVDANREDREHLKALLQNEYLVDIAPDALSALTRMRYYGSALSIVLIDIHARETQDFELLKRVHNTPEMRGVPVIVVNGADDRETTLTAIRNGATDFITKPVNPELLRLRIDAAISRADNERLRAQNSFLQLRQEDIARYQTALGDMGMFVVEMDWIKGTFVYDGAITQFLKGHYDERSLWRILLSDMVADALDVRKAQDFIHQLAEDHARDSAVMEMLLRTPSNEIHRFSLHARKLYNPDGLTHKLIITFKDLGSA